MKKQPLQQVFKEPCCHCRDHSGGGKKRKKTANRPARARKGRG